MLWVHSRTRFAQARAELGMTDRTGGPSSNNYQHRKRPENYNEDEDEWSEGEDVSKLKARGDNIHDNPGDDEEERLQNQDLALARSLRLRAEGLEKVVTAMLGQPPPIHPIPDEDILTPPSSPKMKPSDSPDAPHPHKLPNGVRLRLALGSTINDLFARQAPIPPYRHQFQLVKSPSDQSPAESTSTYSAPDSIPLALTQLSTVCASCNPISSTTAGASRLSPSHLSTSPSAPATQSYPGYSPQPNLPPRLQQNRIAPSQRVRRLYVEGADPSTANSPPRFRCPRHLHTGCEICVEAKTPTRPTGSSRNRSTSTSFGDFRSSSANPWKSMPGGVGPGGGGISGWREGSGVGSGLLRPGVHGNVLRRKSEEEESEDAAVASGAGNTKLSDLIPRFIRLSALVAVELANEARDEEEAGLAALRARQTAGQQSVADWASSSSQAQQQQYRVVSSGSGTSHQQPISPRARIISPPPNPSQKQPETALRPTREWYNLLAGLLTRAALQGYLTASWRGQQPVECLLTVGLGIAQDFDRAKEPRSGFEEFDPDGLPSLLDATRLLFPSLQVLAPPGKAPAEEEYEAEMKERLRRFYDIPASTPDLSTHMEDLAWQFPAEPVERAAVRFCEAIARWRGKPELETYKKPATTTYDSFPTPGGSSISMESFINSSPPSAQRRRPSHHRRPSIDMYFTQPTLLREGMWSRNKRPREPEDNRAGPSKRVQMS